MITTRREPELCGKVGPPSDRDGCREIVSVQCRPFADVYLSSSPEGRIRPDGGGQAARLGRSSGQACSSPDLRGRPVIVKGGSFVTVVIHPYPKDGY